MEQRIYHEFVETLTFNGLESAIITMFADKDMFPDIDHNLTADSKHDVSVQKRDRFDLTLYIVRCKIKRYDFIESFKWLLNYVKAKYTWEYCWNYSRLIDGKAIGIVTFKIYITKDTKDGKD